MNGLNEKTNDKPSDPVETHYPFRFRGSGGEFFGIWLINTLLSIITIGIYSPWAKVRTARYFYGNTYLGDHSFDYHASGRQLLFGRFVAVVLYGGFFFGYESLIGWNFTAGLVLLALFSLAVPCLIMLSLRFAARNSSYRNVGFGFKGSSARSIWVWFGLPFIVYLLAAAAVLIPFGYFTDWEVLKAFTAPEAMDNSKFDQLVENDALLFGILGGAALVLLIGLALAKKKASEYFGSSHGFAGHQLKTKMRYRGLLWSYIGFSLFLFVFLALGLLIAVSLTALLLNVRDGVPFLMALEHSFAFLNPVEQVVLTYLIIFLVVIPAFGFLNTMVRNRLWRGSELLDGKVKLQSRVNPFRFTWIIFTNGLLTIASLGLLRPWCMVRRVRYVAHRSSVIASIDLDGFTGAIHARGRASAAEFTDMEGMDFGLGL